MPELNAPLVSFNGGEIGQETLDRVTLDNYAAMGETFENFLLDANGPMQMRPGLNFQVDSGLGANAGRIQPFVRSLDNSDKFLLVLSNNNLNIFYSGGFVTRPSVTSSITDGDFTALTGWTDISASPATATIVSNRLALNADGTNEAGVRQAVSTSNSGTLHAVTIQVHHGPVQFQIGSTSGGDELLSKRTLRTGYHSLAFIPDSGTYYVEFTSTLYRQVEVEDISVESAGDLAVTTPWATARLQYLRFQESKDVMYVADGNNHHMRIERWDNNSWSVVETTVEDGPFRAVNADENLTLTPSVRIGTGTMAASEDLFESDHVGSIWQLTQTGQFQSRSVSGENQWTDPIQVEGTGSGRTITWTVSGTYVGTVRIQRSIGNTTSWQDATTAGGATGTVSTTGTGTFTYNDDLDNNVVYYRVGIKTGEYTSGNPTVEIEFPFLSTEGVVRVTNYTDAQNVDIEVLSTLATTDSTALWKEGSWSDNRGWPNCLNLFDGRLWTAKEDSFWGSYSEAFESHEIDEGNSSAIARSIAVGHTNDAQWMMGVARLIIGSEAAEIVVRSNAFDEPLTTDNMTVREMSTYGVANVQPLKVDTRVIYVDRSNFRLMEIVYNVQLQDYVARPLSLLHRDIGRPGITQIAAARNPDTRIFCRRSDGQVLVKLFDPGENILGWSRWFSDGASGTVESVAVLPGDGTTGEDEVYFLMVRTVNGSTVRYIEKLGPIYYETATEAACVDSYLTYDGASTTTLTGLDHLEGEVVTVWGNGGPLGTYTVSSGSITLSSAVTHAHVGLDYRARYKSTKLAFGAQKGTALGQVGDPYELQLILRNTYKGGIKIGQDFTTMDELDNRVATGSYDTATPLVSETTEVLALPGDSSMDSRLCIEVNAPFPAIIQGVVIGHELTER